MQKVILVSLGAVLGALARYFFSQISWLKGYNILFINLLGCFIAGFFIERIKNPDIKIALFVGFLGSYTTLSTYSLELMEIIDAKKYFKALFYFFSTSLGGFLCAYFARFLSKSL